ncbi:hypothetical protein Bbelb_279310 [Branchiostoma belcheri]|nr:hypothetical protein Bbelb_279310 [Branchiostoma belcheri]
MASHFPPAGLYNSRNRRETGPESIQPRTTSSTPVNRGGRFLFQPTPTRAEVSNEQLYRCIMNLGKTLGDVLAESKRHSEALQQFKDTKGAQISELKQEVAYLRQCLDARTQEDAAMSHAPKRQMKKHSRHLSDTVRRLHNGETSERQYNGDSGLHSPHNEAVTTFLMTEVASQFPEEHPDTIRC